MSKEIVKMSDLTDRVKERVKDIFAELIPEKMWDSLVKAEIEKFRKDILPNIVEQELRRVYTEKIQEELEKSEYVANWFSGNHQPGVEVKRMIKELAPDFVSAIFGSVIQQAIERIGSDIRNGTFRPY